MRRKIATVALLGGLAAGLGCHHIAGKSDCGYNPADHPIGEPTPPHPFVPAPPLPQPKEKGQEELSTIKTNSDKTIDAMEINTRY